MSLTLLIAIILLIVFFGGGWYGRSAGYYGNNGLIGLLVAVLVIFALLSFVGAIPYHHY